MTSRFAVRARRAFEDFWYPEYTGQFSGRLLVGIGAVCAAIIGLIHLMFADDGRTGLLVRLAARFW
jgi:hypothetical protein